jgi:8-oxo-dGTP diphosphatase
MPSHQPIAVVVAFLQREGTVLLTRRPLGGPCGGYWELPGGKIEPGETAPAALVRELHEELGVHAIIDSPLGELTFAYPALCITLKAWAGRVRTGPPHPRHATALQWVPLERLLCYPLPPATVALLMQMRATGRLPGTALCPLIFSHKASTECRTV